MTREHHQERPSMCGNGITCDAHVRDFHTARIAHHKPGTAQLMAAVPAAPVHSMRRAVARSAARTTVAATAAGMKVASTGKNNKCRDALQKVVSPVEGRQSDEWASSNPLLTALAGKRSRNATLVGTSQQHKEENGAQPQQGQQQDHQHRVQHRQQEDQQGHEKRLQTELQKPQRPLCKTCMRPQRVCICKALAAVGGPISLAAAFTGVLEAVVVYVHPLETKRKSRSLTLLQQLVNPVHVFSGRKPRPVEQLLPLDHPRNLLLLFPTVHSRPLPVISYEHSCPLVTSLPVPAAAGGATDVSPPGPVEATEPDPTGGPVRDVSFTAVRIAEEYATSGAGCRDAVACSEAVSRLAAPATSPISSAPASISVAFVDPASAPLPVLLPKCAGPAAADFLHTCNDPATAQPAAAPTAATLRGSCVSSGPLAACFPLQLPLTLVCLDGTWKECKEMFRSVEWLQHLPAVHLVFPTDSNSAEQQQQQARPGQVQQRQHIGQQPTKQLQDLEEKEGKQGCLHQRDDTGKPRHQLERVGTRPTPQQDTQQSYTEEREAANPRKEPKRCHVLIGRLKDAKECKLLQEQQPTQQDLDEHDTQFLSDKQRSQQMHHHQKPSHGPQEPLQGHGVYREECSYVVRCGLLYQQQKSCRGIFSSVRTPPAAIAGAGGVCTAEAICHTVAAIARYSRCSSIRAFRCDDDMCQLLKYVAQQQDKCRQEAQRHGSTE